MESSFAISTLGLEPRMNLMPDGSFYQCFEAVHFGLELLKESFDGLDTWRTWGTLESIAHLEIKGLHLQLQLIHIDGSGWILTHLASHVIADHAHLCHDSRQAILAMIPRLLKQPFSQRSHPVHKAHDLLIRNRGHSYATIG